MGASGALAQNLTIGIGGSPTTLDPHFYNASPNISLTQHMFDRLVEQDAEARLQPMLAESWRPLSETVWEFKLRPGVKWHDGRDFTADDVVFTIERVPNVRNSPGTFAGMIRAITRAEIMDPLTIRFHTAAPHPLPAPFIASNYEHAKLLPITAATISKGFALLDPQADDFGKRWANRMTALHKGAQPGETITFKFKGTRCSIYDIIGPDCGQVIVTVDDKPAKVVPRFDSFSTYHRLATIGLGSELEDKIHTVKLEIHPEQVDKAKVLATRNNKIDKPERYDGRAFYPGAILLVGELVK